MELIKWGIIIRPGEWASREKERVYDDLKRYGVNLWSSITAGDATEHSVEMVAVYWSDRKLRSFRLRTNVQVRSEFESTLNAGEVPTADVNGVRTGFAFRSRTLHDRIIDPARIKKRLPVTLSTVTRNGRTTLIVWKLNIKLWTILQKNSIVLTMRRLPGRKHRHWP